MAGMEPCTACITITCSCAPGGGPQVMCGAQFDADGGVEENNYLYSSDCSVIVAAAGRVLKPRSH